MICECAPTNMCSSNGEISSVYLCSSPASPPLHYQEMGESVLFICAAIPRPATITRQEEVSGRVLLPYKDEKSNFVPGEQLRRSYISLTAHLPLPDDPITLPLFFQIGPHLFLSFAKLCCLCLSCSLRSLSIKLSSWRAPRARP